MTTTTTARQVRTTTAPPLVALREAVAVLDDRYTDQGRDGSLAHYGRSDLDAILAPLAVARDLFERQERTIEEQRVEILRLSRGAEFAEARDTRNKKQLTAAKQLREGLTSALATLIPKLEELVAALHAAESDAPTVPLLR